MDEERPEVYERIPWETLDSGRSDRQWLVYAAAGAVVLGALVYSFVRSQPTAPAPPQEAVATTAPVATTTSLARSTPSTASSPVVVAEADLFAVDPERLIDQAAAQAEWFAVEYMSVDGSEESSSTLASLLPSGVPPPSAPQGTQVYVDWVRARSVTQTGPVSYDVEVLVRTLVSQEEEGFVRQPTRVLVIPIEIGEDGTARVAGVPSLETVPAPAASRLTLGPVPQELLGQSDLADAEVVGGMQEVDGGWEVVVMATGSDGVTRPVAIHP